jgi:hypothetical protein
MKLLAAHIQSGAPLHSAGIELKAQFFWGTGLVSCVEWNGEHCAARGLTAQSGKMGNPCAETMTSKAAEMAIVASFIAIMVDGGPGPHSKQLMVELGEGQQRVHF